MILFRIGLFFLLMAVLAIITVTATRYYVMGVQHGHQQKEAEELRKRLELAAEAIQTNPELFTVQTASGPKVLTPEDVVNGNIM